MAELMRVFGPLRANTQADTQAPFMHTIGDAVLVEVLREQLRQAQEREMRLLTRVRLFFYDVSNLGFPASRQVR